MDTPAASCAIVLPHPCVCIVAVMLHLGWRSRAKQRSNIWMDSSLSVSYVLSYGCGLPDLCPMMWSAHSAELLSCAVQDGMVITVHAAAAACLPNVYV